MVEDIVRSLGFLTLGSRLKRIGERMQADAAEIGAAHGFALGPGQYTFLEAIDRLGPLTVTEVAAAIGITQPGATRNIAELARLGLVKIAPGKKDQRQRVASLTPKGRKQVAFGQQEIWPRIEAAVADLCDGLSGPLLAQLAAIEDGLAETPLIRRVDRPRRER
jgi:DNA-binding MarR family transcriptional regulator